MKILLAIAVTSTVLSAAAIAVAATSANASMATALGAVAMSKAGPELKAPAIKDLEAARELELERAKFNQTQNDKLQGCVVAAKTATDLSGCQTAYRDAVSAHTLQLMQDGRFAAAYDLGPAHPPLAPIPVTEVKK
jgi:hypothetical protein